MDRVAGQRDEGHRLSANEAWHASDTVGRIAELASALPGSEEQARAMLRVAAEGIGRTAALSLAPDLVASMRERVSVLAPSAFFDFAHDGAASFGDPEAAITIHATIAALLEAIKIIDDIHDEEAVCLATQIGTAAALNVAMAAYAWSLELTAALPFPESSWRTAANAVGRGIRETAIGQMLETTIDSGFEDFWNVVDKKTPPLVGTALELGALAAGASPAEAASLTRLAIPLGRLLQIGDDCHDALGPEASDWRSPANNLLLRFSLCGPQRQELAALLRNAIDPESLRASQILLLRDGALAYAMHAQQTTMRALAETIEALALPNPAPFLASLDRHQSETGALLRKSGLAQEIA